MIHWREIRGANVVWNGLAPRTSLCNGPRPGEHCQVLAACKSVVRDKGAGPPVKYDEKEIQTMHQTATKNQSLLQKMLNTAHQHSGT